jgi:hypothetical protein
MGKPERLRQQHLKTGLPKVLIGGERIGDAHLLHHHKRHAVRESPLFVGPRLKQAKCLMVELIRQWDDSHLWISLQSTEQGNGSLAIALFRESITDLQENGTRGDQPRPSFLQTPR